jgi:hypothetical protein
VVFRFMTQKEISDRRSSPGPRNCLLGFGWGRLDYGRSCRNHRLLYRQ